MTSFEGFPNPIKGQEQPPEEEKIEDEEIADIMNAINKPEPAIKMPDMPDDDLTMEEKKKKEKSDDLNSEDLAEMEEIIPPEVAQERDKAKQTEIEKIKKQRGENELELKTYQDALGKIGNNPDKKNAIKSLQESIAYFENKKLELKDELDILGGKEKKSIDNIEGKEVTIEKIKMKAGKSSEVGRGKKFSGICQKEISIGEIAHISSPETEGGIKTSEIESIKACPDGSYILETGTSFYRLNLTA